MSSQLAEHLSTPSPTPPPGDAETTVMLSNLPEQQLCSRPVHPVVDHLNRDLLSVFTCQQWEGGAGGTCSIKVFGPGEITSVEP